MVIRRSLPATCSICGATADETAPHTWTPATFLTPKTCTVCGATEGGVIEGYTEDFETDTDGDGLADGWTTSVALKASAVQAEPTDAVSAFWQVTVLANGNLSPN